MDAESIAEWVERFQIILTAIPVLVALAGKAWHDIQEARKVWAEKKQAGYLEAATYLWSKGQGIKPLLKAAGQGGDFLQHLRDLAPSALHKYGQSHGFTDAEIQRVMDLARAIHKRKKAERLPGASAILELEPEPMEGEPGGPPEGVDAG